MDQASTWLNDVKAVLLAQFAEAVAYLPNLAGALLVLGLGWVLARMLRTTAVRLGDAINRILEPLMPSGRLVQFRVSGRATRVIGDIIFALVVFLAAVAAAKVARMETVSHWLESIVTYLPQLFGGAMIVLIGYVLSASIRDLVASTLASVRAGHSELIGALAQWATFLTALIVGINQIGIDVTFLIVLIAIVLGALLGGMALAFGLGAGPLARNLIGSHYLQQQYTVGQNIKIGDLEGQILDFTPTGMELETSQGRSTIPGSIYFEKMITVRDGRQDHG